MRIKRSVHAKKKRRTVLKETKGFLGSRKSCYRKAKEALVHAKKNAYKDRKIKKRTRRALWQVNINNAVRLEDLSYSKFMNLLKTNQIELDRKVLAQIAKEYPAVFKKLTTEMKTKQPVKTTEPKKA